MLTVELKDLLGLGRSPISLQKATPSANESLKYNFMGYLKRGETTEVVSKLCPLSKLHNSQKIHNLKEQPRKETLDVLEKQIM